jgi:hypothetical protein
MDTHYLYRTHQDIPVTQARQVNLRLSLKNFDVKLQGLLERSSEAGSGGDIWEEIKGSSNSVILQLQILQATCRIVDLEEQSHVPAELNEAITKKLFTVQSDVHNLSARVQEEGYLARDKDWEIIGKIESEIRALTPLRLQISMGLGNAREENPSQESHSEIDSTFSGFDDLTISICAPGVAERSTDIDLEIIDNSDPLDYMGSELEHRLGYPTSFLREESKTDVEARYFKRQLYDIARAYAIPLPDVEDASYRMAKRDALWHIADWITVSSLEGSQTG